MEEVEILAGLAHPKTVPLFGFARDRNTYRIIMELMDRDLPSLMKDRLLQYFTLAIPFLISEAEDLMLQTTEGMRYLHHKRVMHRDLKAQNIFAKSGKDINGAYEFMKLKVADEIAASQVPISLQILGP
jgi:serine/threonine protein kinase